MKSNCGTIVLSLGVLCLGGSTVCKAAESVLHGFGNERDGLYPYAGLLADNKGALYGTTYEGGFTGNISCNASDGCGTVFRLTPPGQGQTEWTQTVLHKFGNGTDGRYPLAGLIADSKGSLYGTTYEGGSDGYGAVFKLTPPAAAGSEWTETVLYSFTGGNDGAYPYASLIADTKGALYSTTYGGGSHGYGTVFVLTAPAPNQTDAEWTETVIHNFDDFDGDGRYPVAGLIADSQGTIYGTTEYGGTGCSHSGGCGTVFELMPTDAGKTAWNLTILYSFCSVGSCDDGSYPQASLLADKQGALYGTTYSGGYGGGVVFKLSRAAQGRARIQDEAEWTQTVLHKFAGYYTVSDDGAFVYSGLLADNQGALYGTTYGGGLSCGQTSNGCGTVFKLTPPAQGQTEWTENVLYAFGQPATCNDGAFPLAGLIADKQGVLYGTTYEGGGSNCPGFGTVFQLTTSVSHGH